MSVGTGVYPINVIENASDIPLGWLVSSRGERFGGKVYYVCNGTRHWIPSPEHAEANHLPFPDGIHWVDDDELAKLRLGGNVPKPWRLRNWYNPPRRSSGILREIAASQLNGSGVEFGAGYNPFPIPLRCSVQYADRWSVQDYRNQYHAGSDFVDTVTPDVQGDLQETADIADGSLDFLVACHVIEHTPNPIRAMANAYRMLKLGGKLVLVVPDKRYTFDKDRELTPLAHLILDYQEPLRERDWPHYLEFCTKAINVPIEGLYELVKYSFDNNGDIHFHTWTYETFLAMIEYIREHVNPWSEVWSQPPVREPEEGIEFYVVLTK